MAEKRTRTGYPSGITQEMADACYQSYLNIYREREESERKERELLNSGFAAFEEWENRTVGNAAEELSEEESSWINSLRAILDEVGQWPPKPSHPTEAESKAKLRSLGWKSKRPFLVYGFEETSNEGINAGKITINDLEYKDRDVANLISKVRDKDGNRMFFCTLMVFERQVHGKANKRRRSSEKNDRDIFVSYGGFDEIEVDKIQICKWSPLKESESWSYWCLKDDDTAIFLQSILNEGGLRGMFVGKTPTSADESSVTFHRVAMVFCPVANVLKLDELGPLPCYRSMWLLKYGCFIAPQPVKEQIPLDAMEKIRERTTREELAKGSSVFQAELQMVLDILQDANSVLLILEFVSTLITGAKELPNNEEEFSVVITKALMGLTAPLFLAKQSSTEREELCRLAKDRLMYLSEATKHGEPTLNACQKDAIFSPDAKFSEQVQEFLRGDLEEQEFGPFDTQKKFGCYRSQIEAKSWADTYFGSVSFEGICSNSLDGETAQNIGKYSAEATINESGSMVKLNKRSDVLLKYEVERYEVHLAALEKLLPVFGSLVQ